VSGIAVQAGRRDRLDGAFLMGDLASDNEFILAYTLRISVIWYSARWCHARQHGLDSRLYIWAVSSLLAAVDFTPHEGAKHLSSLCCSKHIRSWRRPCSLQEECCSSNCITSISLETTIGSCNTQPLCEYTSLNDRLSSCRTWCR
jgi:hypothetical protein